jgi:hypothetical protein
MVAVIESVARPGLVSRAMAGPPAPPTTATAIAYSSDVSPVRSTSSTLKTETLAAHSTYRPFHPPCGLFLLLSLLFWLFSALTLFSWTFDAALRAGVQSSVDSGRV